MEGSLAGATIISAVPYPLVSILLAYIQSLFLYVKNTRSSQIGRRNISVREDAPHWNGVDRIRISIRKWEELNWCQQKKEKDPSKLTSLGAPLIYDAHPVPTMYTAPFPLMGGSVSRGDYGTNQQLSSMRDSIKNSSFGVLSQSFQIINAFVSCDGEKVHIQWIQAIRNSLQKIKTILLVHWNCHLKSSWIKPSKWNGPSLKDFESRPLLQRKRFLYRKEKYFLVQSSSMGRKNTFAKKTKLKLNRWWRLCLHWQQWLLSGPSLFHDYFQLWWHNSPHLRGSSVINC